MKDSNFFKYLDTHPFKVAVRNMLEDHFAPDLSRRFVFEYEAKKYNMDNNQEIRKQVKDENFIMEVWYQQKDGLVSEFICDLYSWETKKQCEARLLRGITDKARVGKIGLDWGEKGGVIGISQDVLSGKHETIVN